MRKSQSILFQSIKWCTVWGIINFMEQNKLDMLIKEQGSYLIVVFGPPASGKTTLTQQIRQNYSQYCKKNNYPQSCILVSADCFEEYLTNHSIFQLEQLLSERQGWEFINTMRLKRRMFEGQKWKLSRDYIKNSVAKWLKKWKVVILEDDFLLKSQRKQLRQIVEYSQTMYIQIHVKVNLQQCLINLKKRSEVESYQEQLSTQIIKNVFEKFQVDSNPYCFSCSTKQEQIWSFILQNAKKVQIAHPQQKQKSIVSEQNRLNDLAQTQIRAYVSQVMRSEDLKRKFFKERPLKQAASLLNKFKKNYKAKVKSLSGFVAYVQFETTKLE